MNSSQDKKIQSLSRLANELHDSLGNDYMTTKKRKIIRKKINAIKKEIRGIHSLENKRLGNTCLKVSDHAIVRFLERLNGINIEEIKKQIATESVKNNAKFFGDGKYAIDCGQAIVQDNVVVSVI